MPDFRSRYTYIFCVAFVVFNYMETSEINNKVARYTKLNKCYFTAPERVNECPKDNTTLRERAQQKMCNRYPKCQGKQLLYHCVRSIEDLVEVCAPRWHIIGQYCSVYEKGLGRVSVDLFRNCSECPLIYNSTESWIYSKCLKTNPETRTYQTSTVVTKTTLENKVDTFIYRINETNNLTATTENASQPTRKIEDFKPVKYIYVIGLAVLCIMLLVGFHCILQ